MCGIVGAIAERNVVPLLLEGLKRLEYRGYDSAGVAILDASNNFQRLRRKGRVQSLIDAIHTNPIQGHLGIAHTRWATHGAPTEQNAHPHVSHDDVAIVHNGIIENFAELKRSIAASGVTLTSETDTEVVAHLLYQAYQQTQDARQAILTVLPQLKGSYSLGIVFKAEPNHLYGVRHGSPLVLGIGKNENYIASDAHALHGLTTQVIYLEEGDIIDCTLQGYDIINRQGEIQQRQTHTLKNQVDLVSCGDYKHYMQKEIFEQPEAIRNTLSGRLSSPDALSSIFSKAQQKKLQSLSRIHIIACGTSYHAALVGRYWIETLANLPVVVDIASEYRYRDVVVEPNTLFISISQSGETADTIAALQGAKAKGGYTNYMAICNVPESSLVRESDMIMMTAAGIEIGVASTKAFSTQLVNLLLFALILAEQRRIQPPRIQAGIQALLALPTVLDNVLSYDQIISEIAQLFAAKQHALFLGRGIHYPIALEGALKLKEISYIHAEAYPAGELKHGPLALVDKDMPIIAIAPQDHLLEKLKSNLEEVRARGGELFVFADKDSNFESGEGITLLDYPIAHPLIAPIVHTIPLQLLAYHVAVCKGTDVDKPRNLAKSVTVE